MSQSKSRSWLERFIALLAREPQDRDQLMEMLRNAEERDVLSAEILGMIERIMHVSEMQVRDVMVPKAQMVVVQKNSRLADILPFVIESGHSRFPVVDPSKKDIVGMLLAKDLLKYFNKDPNQFNINDIMRPAVFTPQSKRLDILLREFRATRNHIAIVLDEYGHVEGLVTIEDVLEQIVGEIEDEYDIEEEDTQIKKLAEDTFIVKASTLIEEFNAYFHSNFSDEEFDTIGGIVLQGFGHLPKRGENIKIQQFRFKVLHSDSRRIYLLEVKVGKGKKKSEG
ncbi:MAG: CBS domain-containing protein [Gammaproteobacteria bacterium]|nr:MAG: CBS domain-containing protein [Gammaproteobacteria bacterium]